MKIENPQWAIRGRTFADKEDPTAVVETYRNPPKRSKQGRVQQVFSSEMFPLFGGSSQLYINSQSIALNVLVQQFVYGREIRIRGAVGLLCWKDARMAYTLVEKGLPILLMDWDWHGIVAWIMSAILNIWTGVFNDDRSSKINVTQSRFSLTRLSSCSIDQVALRVLRQNILTLPYQFAKTIKTTNPLLCVVVV